MNKMPFFGLFTRPSKLDVGGSMLDVHLFLALRRKKNGALMLLTLGTIMFLLLSGKILS